MKKILSLLLSVCLVVTMIPAISFAADGDQASGDGNVVSMGTQEEIVGEGSAGDPEVVEGPAETAGGEEPSVVEDPTVPEQDVNANPDNEVPDGNGVVEEPPVVEGQQQVLNDSETRDVLSGWKKDENTGNWRYYVNNNYLTGMQTLGGAVYLFDSANGYMLTGLKTYSVDKCKYYFNPNGPEPGGLDSSLGARMTGWINPEGKGDCYFNPMMKTGWTTISGKQYYLDKTTGVKTIGWQRKTIDSNTYCFDSNGVLQTGWKSYSSGRYYFDPSTGAMKTGFVQIGNGQFLFNSNGVMQTGWKKVGSNARNSYFNPSTGRMQTGWANIGGKWYYLNTSNGMYTVGWENIGGAKYFFDKKSGVMKTGWQKKTIDKKNYYYFYPSTGKMAKGWTTISKNRYFFNTSNGKMARGWLKYKKKKYYLTKSGKKIGVMVTGMKKISGSYYFFNKHNGAMKSNGCEKVSKKLYYFAKNGKARWTKGWFKGSDKKKRYCLGKGVLATGKKKIGSNWYIFSKTDGTVTKSLGDDLDQKVQSKSSATRYLIAIKRSTYEVRVYTGSKNNWTRAKKFKCAIGASATPTKTGTYTISDKGVKKTFEVTNPDGTQTDTRYWYWCYYTGTHGVHSGLYYNGGPKDGQDYDTRVGVKSTNGGIRVDYSNAKWIYNNVPLSTKVVVY